MPPWAANMQANMQAALNHLQGTLNDVQADIQNLRIRFDQQPILIANSQAGTLGRLRDPTQVLPNGTAPHLNPPHPQTRDELLRFTGEL